WRAAALPGPRACCNRGRDRARRQLEPGENAVVAQPLGFEMPAPRAQSQGAVALRQAATRAATRRIIDVGGGGTGAGAAWPTAGNRERTWLELRAIAQRISISQYTRKVTELRLHSGQNKIVPSVLKPKAASASL